MESTSEVTLSNTVKTKVAAYDFAWQPWVVCFSAALFFFFEFMQVNLFNALDPALIRSFQVEAKTLASMSQYYFLANVLFLFPAGMILDRFSTRRIIIGAMSASVACTIGFALAQAVWQAELCRFVTGIGGAFCFLSCVRLASRWFEAKRMALVVGLTVTFAMTGGMLAQAPFTLLTDAIGWRKALLADGAMGIVMLGIIIAFVKNSPPGYQQALNQQHKALAGIGFWPTLTKVLGNAQNWFGGLYTSLMNLPIFLLGAMWGSLYLVQIHHLSRADSTWVTLMIFLGTIIGSPVLGALSDKIRRRRLPMLVGALLALLIVFILMYAPHLSFLSLLGLFFLLGFITSTQIISYPLIAESNPQALTGTAEGMASVLIMAGGFSQWLFAWLMERHWQHHYVAKLPVYSVHDYRSALMIMPVAFILALMVGFLLKETYCRAYTERN